MDNCELVNAARDLAYRYAEVRNQNTELRRTNVRLKSDVKHYLEARLAMEQKHLKLKRRV